MLQRQFLSLCLLSSIALTNTGCSKPETEQSVAAQTDASKEYDTGPIPGVDYHSFANTDDYRVRHVDMDLTVDFSRKVLEGEAILHFDRLNDSNNPLILDTRDLVVESVRAGQGDELRDTTFTLIDSDDFLGEPLTIDLPSGATTVAVRYKTVPEASGLQWLDPIQTAGKKHPFLFSQAQAIHARSFVPLQDTPGVRITYNATIRTPIELRAVMSANNDANAEKNGVYEFSMPQPIPSYLIAIAVGDLEFRAMGERTGVYSEKGILDAAAAEFADTESMLEMAEDVYGPYRWDRYDLLILPPSFPFGGMENPRLSFITPTVIAGDKSLVSLIAHELAHSWSGNLITNSSWRDLWLNEGFTTYLTGRIMQFVYGDERYEMEAARGYSGLVAELEGMDDAAQILAADMRGIDPDMAFSGIPYQKGSLFLLELEQKVGRDEFDQFLLNYFNEFAFESLATEDFLAYLEQTLLKTHMETLDMDRIKQWIYEPGIPDGAPQPTSDAFTKLDPVRQGWLDGEIAASSIDTNGWTYHQWNYFIDNMPQELSADQLAELDETFGFTASANNEIAFSWMRIGIRNDYGPAFMRLEDFLMNIGRNKFLMPLYQDLMDNDKADFAVRVFEQARPGYHPLTVKRNSQIVYPEAAE